MSSAVKTESIYSFLPKAEVVVQKPPLYKSTYREKVHKDWKKPKMEKATFGPLHEDKPEQHDYLKSKSGDKRRLANKRIPSSKHIREVIKGPIFAGIAKLPESLPKNYVTTNIDTADHLMPTVQPQKTLYVKKQTYGKTPGYLARIKQELTAKKREANKAPEPPKAPEGYIFMPEHERKEAVSLLTARLQQLKLDYGKMSLVIDTVPKKNKKVALEKQIDEVGSYLDELVSNKAVLVKLD